MLVENSSAKSDEQRGRADGRACISLGTGEGPDQKAHKKLGAQCDLRHHGKAGLGRQRERPAIRDKQGFVIP
jgi:hypothetical protein